MTEKRVRVALAAEYVGAAIKLRLEGQDHGQRPFHDGLMWGFERALAACGLKKRMDALWSAAERWAKGNCPGFGTRCVTGCDKCTVAAGKIARDVLHARS